MKSIQHSYGSLFSWFPFNLGVPTKKTATIFPPPQSNNDKALDRTVTDSSKATLLAEISNALTTFSTHKATLSHENGERIFRFHPIRAAQKNTKWFVDHESFYTKLNQHPTRLWVVDDQCHSSPKTVYMVRNRNNVWETIDDPESAIAVLAKRGVGPWKLQNEIGQCRYFESEETSYHELDLSDLIYLLPEGHPQRPKNFSSLKKLLFNTFAATAVAFTGKKAYDSTDPQALVTQSSLPGTLITAGTTYAVSRKMGLSPGQATFNTFITNLYQVTPSPKVVNPPKLTTVKIGEKVSYSHLEDTFTDTNGGTLKISAKHVPPKANFTIEKTKFESSINATADRIIKTKDTIHLFNEKGPFCLFSNTDQPQQLACLYDVTGVGNVVGNNVFVSGDTFFSIDAQTPSAPKIVSQIPSPVSNPKSMTVMGDTAWVSGAKELASINIHNASHPTTIQTFPLDFSWQGKLSPGSESCLYGTRNWNGGFAVINGSDPHSLDIKKIVPGKSGSIDVQEQNGEIYFSEADLGVSKYNANLEFESRFYEKGLFAGSNAPGGGINWVSDLSATHGVFGFDSSNAVYTRIDLESTPTALHTEQNQLIISDKKQTSIFRLSDTSFSWVPEKADRGNHTITLEATDGKQTASAPIEINVVGHKPTIVPIPPKTAVVGETLTIPINATDPEHDPITISAPDKPDWLKKIDPITFSGTPKTTDTGHVSFDVIAKDRDGETKAPVSITVKPKPIVTTGVTPQPTNDSDTTPLYPLLNQTSTGGLVSKSFSFQKFLVEAGGAIVIFFFIFFTPFLIFCLFLKRKSQKKIEVDRQHPFLQSFKELDVKTVENIRLVFGDGKFAYKTECLDELQTLIDQTAFNSFKIGKGHYGDVEIVEVLDKKIRKKYGRYMVSKEISSEEKFEKSEQEAKLQSTASKSGIQVGIHPLPFTINDTEKKVKRHILPLAKLGSLTNFLDIWIRFFSDERSFVTHIAKTILTGVSEGCHDQNIAHRDLKPANILVDEDGKITVTDFGRAVQVESITTPQLEPDEETDQRYCSPEQIFTRHSETKNPIRLDKCDSWQIGCILLELMLRTDKENRSISEILKIPTHPKELLGSPPSLKNVQKHFSSVLESIGEIKNNQNTTIWFLIKKLMDPDPDKRLLPKEALQLPFFTKKGFPIVRFTHPDDLKNRFKNIHNRYKNSVTVHLNEKKRNLYENRNENKNNSSDEEDYQNRKVVIPYNNE